MAAGGKPFYEREKAGNVRNKALDDVLLVLKDDPKIQQWSDLKKQMLLKLSTNLLPRLNEHTGQDGDAIKVQMNQIIFKDYESKADSE